MLPNFCLGAAMRQRNKQPVARGNEEPETRTRSGREYPAEETLAVHRKLLNEGLKDS